MSLPEGYTQLEYIRLTGTQYINTGYKARYTTRVVLDFELEDTSVNTAIFGGRSGTSSRTFSFFWMAAGNFRSDYGTTQTTVNVTDGSGRHTVDKNKTSTTVDDASVKVDSYTFTGAYNMYLGTVNTAGAAFEPGLTGKIYSCRIEEAGDLERDFVPCADPSGTVGMYDTANGVFYGNSGSGVFEAPAPALPDPPSELAAVLADTGVMLSWSGSENASGYRIYKNGILAADQTETSFLDAEAVGERYLRNRYGVSAYADSGESEKITADVYLSGSGDVMLDLVTDRTLDDVVRRTKKGVYNASDINRVSAAAHRVRTVLAPLGYSTPEVSEYRWAVNEIPTAEEMAAHHASVIGQDVINYSQNKIVLPQSLSRLTHEGANNIERFLLLCGEAAERIPEAYIYSDEIYGGEYN